MIVQSSAYPWTSAGGEEGLALPAPAAVPSLALPVSSHCDIIGSGLCVDIVLTGADAKQTYKP